MITVSNLTMKFGKFTALNNVSATFVPGQIVGVVGPNGCGKTTLFKCITNINTTFSGQIMVSDKTQIGFVLDTLKAYGELTLDQNIRYFSLLRECDPTFAEYLIDTLRFPKELRNQKMKTYSFGTAQKANTILSLLNDPDIIILDEPFRGLDPMTVTSFKFLLNEFKRIGKTVIFSSHDINDVEEVCDQVLVMGRGCILGVVNAKEVGNSLNISFNTSNDAYAMQLLVNYNPYYLNGFINLQLVNEELWPQILIYLTQNNIQVLNVSNNSSLMNRVLNIFRGYNNVY